MSEQSRKAFEAWCLTGKPADAWTNWQLCWQASRAAALEEVVSEVEALDRFDCERDSGMVYDDNGLFIERSECIDAIRSLAEKTGKD